MLLKEQDAGDKDKIALQRSVVDEILNTKAELDVREQV